MPDPVTLINNSWYVSLWCFPAGSKKRGFQRKELVLWRNGHLSEHNENPPPVAIHPARDRNQPQLMEVRRMWGLKRAESIWPKHFEVDEKSVGLDLRNLLSFASLGIKYTDYAVYLYAFSAFYSIMDTTLQNVRTESFVKNFPGKNTCHL